MHIFIDESGSFVHAPGGQGLSVVGALVIPEHRMTRVIRQYQKLRTGLPQRNGEVKGRHLNEDQVSAIVELLCENRVLLEVTAVDLSDHTRADVEAHKLRLKESIDGAVDDSHGPEVHAWAHDLGKSVSGLANQLYVQSVVMFELVWRTCAMAASFFSQRRARELASFRWTVDAKGKGRRTNWEELWATIVLPVLQAKSVAEPMELVPGGNYHYLRRYEAPRPDWLPTPEGALKSAMDLKLMFAEHFRYSAAPEPGLELADIVANATRRFLVGNLRSPNACGLPSIMVHRNKAYISFVVMHERAARISSHYRQRLWDHFRRGGLPMMAPRLFTEIREE